MAKSFIYIILLLLVCADVRAQNPIFGSSITLSGDSGHTFPSYTQTWLLDSGTRANDTFTFSTVAPDSAQVWMYDGHGHIAWTTFSGGGGGLSQIYGVSPISITGTDTVNISGVLVTAPTSGSQNTIIPVGAVVGLTLEQPVSFSASAATYIGPGGSHVLFDALGIAPVVAGGTGLSSTSQNFVFAGPTSGSGAPSFRSLVSGDIPSLSYLSNVLTTTGDIIYSSSGSTASRLGIGSTNNVLSVISGVPSWQPASSVFGDTIFANGIGTAKTPGFVLANTTASTSGATVQAPPPLFWDWHQWSTTATAHDSERLIRIGVVPTSGTNPPLYKLVISSGNANVGYTDIFRLSQAGIPEYPGFGGGGFLSLNASGVMQTGSFAGGDVISSAGTNNGPTGSNQFTAGGGTINLGHLGASSGIVQFTGVTSGLVSLTVNSAAGTATDTLGSSPGMVLTATRAGSAATSGQATLAGGTVVVSTTAINATSLVFLTVDGTAAVGTVESVAVASRIAGTSFTIDSSLITSTSNVDWLIVNP